MIQIKVIHANNDIILETLVNKELATLEQNNCDIKDIQFQHTSVVMDKYTRPSYAAMITYENVLDMELEYVPEEDEINVPIQRD